MRGVSLLCKEGLREIEVSKAPQGIFVSQFSKLHHYNNVSTPPLEFLFRINLLKR
jgi:hypothetical protein